MIIDNSSTDKTVLKIKSDYKEVGLVELKEKIGFCKANHIGLRKALSIGADYVQLLNQDAWVIENTTSGILEVSKKYTEYGILSPIHIANNGQSLDNNFTNYTNGYSCPGLLSDIILKEKIKDVYEINFMNASCWFITRKCLDIIGGSDPINLHYGEDDDYINRVNYHGLKTGICPKYFCVHERLQKSRNIFTFEKYFGGQLFELKKLEKDYHSRVYFTLKLIMAIVKKLFLKRDSFEYKIWFKLLKNYSLINNHRMLSKMKSAKFLVP